MKLEPRIEYRLYAERNGTKYSRVFETGADFEAWIRKEKTVGTIKKIEYRSVTEWQTESLENIVMAIDWK